MISHGWYGLITGILIAGLAAAIAALFLFTYLDDRDRDRDRR